MKINSLKITKYKNLDGAIKFNANLITLLIGQNGVGKSNLLEVFAIIFSGLYRYAQNGNKKIVNVPFGFVIEYECHGNTIQAGMNDGNISLYRKVVGHLLPIPKREFIENYKDYLPSQVFVYYSGENRRIEDVLSSFVKKEFSLRNETYKKGEIVNEPMEIITFNNIHGSLVLLTLLIYKECEEYKEAIKDLLTNVLRINIDSRIELYLQSPNFADLRKLKNDDKLVGTYIDSSTGFTESNRRYSIFWGIQGVINDFLGEILQYVEYTSSPYKHNTYRNGKKERETIDFNQISITEELRQRLLRYFSGPLDFFNMLSEMNSLGMIREIKFYIAKNNNIDTSFPFNQLSEGEQQYLTVMGMIVISKNNRDEMLYLLDEPDTHINPIWQREYINTMVKTIGNAYKDKLSFFISTHSPFLVQSYDDKDTSMLLFCEDKEGNIEIDQSDEIINNWSIDQVLLSKYFNFKSTRPSSFDDFVEKRNQIVEKGQVDDNDIKYLNQITKEMGYLPTGESLNDIKVMAAIHKMYQELKKQKE